MSTAPSKATDGLKRVLVVTDNAPLLQFFQDEWQRQSLTERATVAYRYSAVNRRPAALEELGARSIDLKSSASISEVVGSYDLVLSLHCKQIFPPALVRSVVCINLHPGYNPFNRGWYPQVFAIIEGTPVGATIHLMDEEIDHGAIIAQRAVSVRASDTSLDVYTRVLEAEKQLLQEHLGSLVHGRFAAKSPPPGGTYNSLQDFRSRCQLDLDHVGTLREHIDLLRALTHGEFRNAYFDAADGRRVYTRLLLEDDVATRECHSPTSGSASS